MLSAFMGFIEPGDEVIIFEPFFDQYALPLSRYLQDWNLVDTSPTSRWLAAKWCTRLFNRQRKELPRRPPLQNGQLTFPMWKNVSMTKHAWSSSILPTIPSERSFQKPNLRLLAPSASKTTSSSSPTKSTTAFTMYLSPASPRFHRKSPSWLWLSARLARTSTPRVGVWGGLLGLTIWSSMSLPRILGYATVVWVLCKKPQLLGLKERTKLASGNRASTRWSPKWLGSAKCSTSWACLIPNPRADILCLPISARWNCRKVTTFHRMFRSGQGTSSWVGFASWS